MSETKYIKLDIISKIVAEKHGKSREFIFFDTRVRQIADLRAIFFYFAKTYTRLSLADIGKYSKRMGRNKAHDHATVLYNVNKVEEMMSVDKEFKKRVLELDNEIKYYVDYQTFWFDEISGYKKNVVQLIHSEQNVDFMCKFSEMTTILKENKEFMGMMADIAQKQLIKKQQRIEDERVHKASQENTRLGVV